MGKKVQQVTEIVCQEVSEATGLDETFRRLVAWHDPTRGAKFCSHLWERPKIQGTEGTEAQGKAMEWDSFHTAHRVALLWVSWGE